MSRVKGSKNKTTLIREIAKQKKEEWNGLSQGYQMELWLKEFGSFNPFVAELMGWGTYRVRVADLRRKGFNIKNNHGTGEYTLISCPDENKLPVKPKKEKVKKTNTVKDDLMCVPESMVDELVYVPEPMRMVKPNFKEAILDHLKTYGTINSFQALDLYGCRNLNNVLYTLRKAGYVIVKTENKRIKQQNTKVDRASSVYEFNLIATPNDIVEKTKKDSKYMLVAAIDNDVLRIGLFDNQTDAETGLIETKELYIEALNNSASKNCKFVKSTTTDNIIKVKKGFFKETREVYAKFSIIEV